MNDLGVAVTASEVTRARPWWRNGLPFAVLLLAFNLAMVVDTSFAGRIYAVAFLLVVPGTVLLSSSPVAPRESSVRIAWAIGASLLFIMLLGLAYSLILPHLGMARPLGRWPVVDGVDVLTLASVAAQVRRRDPLQYVLRDHLPSGIELAVAAVLALLPIGAIAGAERLNNGDSGVIALIDLVGVGVVLVGSFLKVERMPTWVSSAALYAGTTAVLLMSSMRSNFPFGYDIQTEFQVFTTTLHQGVWHVPHGNAYAATLSITILPAVLSAVTHTSGIYLFKVVYPLVFGFFPVLVFAMSARWFPGRPAMVGAVIVVVQGIYAADITGIARQEVGLLFFALFVVTAFDASLSRRVRQAAVVTSGVGMAISHYSTSYFAATVLVMGYVTYGILRVVRRRARPAAVFSLPVLALTVGVVFVWNVNFTRSAQNVGNLVSSIGSDGLQLLAGSPGTSLLQRFINADVTPALTPAQFSIDAAAYYRAHVRWVHPYPASLAAKYPLRPVSIRGGKGISQSAGSIVGTATTAVNELLLLLIAIGVLALLWRERKVEHPELAELAAFSFGALVLLGVLRLSGTISALYNAPRGQVQGAPLLSVGLALVCAGIFRRAGAIRVGLPRRFALPRPIAGALSHAPSFGSLAAGAAALVLALLLVSDSGLSDFVFGGGGVDTLVNYGEAYQRFYFTSAELASAGWTLEHKGRRGVIYADVYGGLQINELAHVSGVVNAVIPTELEPGAYVYATKANIVDHTARSVVANDSAEFQFPAAFLSVVKNVVYATATTKVYR